MRTCGARMKMDRGGRALPVIDGPRPVLNSIPSARSRQECIPSVSLEIWSLDIMKVEYINPFLASTISVFETMLNCKLTRGNIHLKNSIQPQHEVSGVIGLSGKAQGTVVLGLSREAAIGATEALLQERPAEINGMSPTPSASW